MSNLFKIATASAETITDSIQDSTLSYDNSIQADSTEHYVVEISRRKNFSEGDNAYIEELSSDEIQDCTDYLNETLSDTNSEVDSFTHGMEIDVYDNVNEKVTDLDSVKVRVYMDSTEGLSNYTLYNFYDGEAKEIEFTTGEDEEHTNLTSYVEFSTDTLGSFLFVTTAEIAPNTSKEESSDVSKKDSTEDSQKLSEESEQISENTPNIISADAAMSFSSLKLSIFKGATKNSDGTYTWSPAGNESGHKFGTRLSYSISGSGKATEGQVRMVLPKNIFGVLVGDSSGNYEMSIPTKQEADEYIAGTNMDIDDDIKFAYYEEGDRIIIYNFREIDQGESGYLEMTYETNKPVVYYTPGDTYTITCTGSISDDSGNQSITKADPVNINFSQLFSVSSSSMEYPTKYNTWNSLAAYGSADVMPENPDDYVYLIANVNSTLATTMTYSVDIQTTIKGSTQEMTDAMKVIGYSRNQAMGFGTNSMVKNCTEQQRRERILIAIDKDTLNNSDSWKAQISATLTFTPSDGGTPITKTVSNTWSWTHPVFEEPHGTLGGFMRGDGGYRNKSAKETSDVFNGLAHWANTMSFHAGDYSRYDLEAFNGYDGETIKYTEYDGFDYASWIGGIVYSYTYDSDNYSSSTKDPEGYGKRNVTFEIKNTGVYLFDPSKADKSVKTSTLTSDDFCYYRIDYSTFAVDAEYDSEDMKFNEKYSVTHPDNEQISFYGRFGSSTKDVLFATHNIKTGSVWYDTNYVSSMSGNIIKLKDSADLVNFTAKTSNTHYRSELYTVPYVKLKNSKTVMDFVKNKEQIAIENCNISNIYSEDASGNLKLESSNEDSDCDYARTMKRSSLLSKAVTSVYNNTKKKYYEFAWSVQMNETATTGDGNVTTVNQESGTFFDLLPKGSTLDLDSISIRNGDGTDTTLNSSEYTVKTYDNYKKSGRTLLVVKINTSGSKYTMTYDTIYSWDSISDYGESVYNPVAYKTGNQDIAGGYPDNGGLFDSDGNKNSNAIEDAELLSGLDEVANDEDATGDAKKYIYAQTQYNFSSLTAASAGLKVKIKGSSDKDYTSSTASNVNQSYSYRLRYQNTANTTSKNLIFFDSLENYNRDSKTTDGSDSQWRGILQSVDTSQAEEKGIKPVIYISTVENLSIDDHYDLKDSSIWTKVTDSTDLSTAKAVAIDLRKTEDGKDYTLDEKESVSVYLYMKAPETAPDLGEGVLPYTYNNGYISSTLIDSVTCYEEDFFIHQDYTSASLSVTGNFGLRKVSSESSNTKISNVTFHLSGTSKYGTVYNQDMITSTNGEIAFDNIEMGEYVLQETKTSNDWVLDSTMHSVVVDAQGNVLIDGETYTDKFISIQNTPRIHTNASFKSVDATYTSKTIEGTQFKLTGTSDYGTTVNQFITSNSNGTVSFRNLEKGVYELIETKATDGYSLNDNVYQLVVDSNGNFSITLKTASDVTKIDVKQQSNTYLIGNEPLQSVAFYEASSWDNSMLSGGKFILTGTSDYGTEVNIEATSDENGQVQFEGLEKGVYTLKQTEAPSGFEKNENTYTVQVSPVFEGNTGDSFTIDGLITNDKILDGNALVFFDSPITETITITKDWDDGEEERLESELNIILTTDKPSQYYASHSITFNANGGAFGNNAENNEVLYGVSKAGVIQTTISGTVLLPTKSGYKFSYWDKSTTAKSYWTTEKDGSGDKYYSIADDVYHVVDVDGNIPTLKSDLVLYAQYQKLNPTLTTGQKFKALIPTTVTSVVFTDEEAPDGVTLTDCSDAGDESVVAWIEPEDETVWKVSSQTSDAKIVMNSNSYGMFTNKAWLTSISFGGYVDTSKATNMMYFFQNCQKLESIDFTGFTTENVTSMFSMFNSCISLKTLDLSSFNTSKVIGMNDMFYNCQSLTTLDVSNFDTSKVTDMSRMFYVCKSLTSLDVSNFDTSNVTNMSGMFSLCISLKSLDLSNFNTKNVTNMSAMFSNEYAKTNTKLEFLNISSFDTSNVTDMNTMFMNLNIDSLDLSNFNTSKVTNMHHMFCYFSSKSINISNFDTSNVTNMSAMFFCCGAESLDLKNFNTSKNTNMWYMFYNCQSLTNLDLSNFDTSKVTDMSGTFYDCRKLTNIYTKSDWDTSSVTNSANMFGDCSNLPNYSSSNIDATKAKLSTNGGYFMKSSN